MVKFTIDQVSTIMQAPNQLRNISVIAHVDHGKTSLIDSLIKKAGIIPEDSNDKRYMQTDKLEQDKGITIKSTAISLFYTLSPESDINLSEGLKSAVLINLIDSPGHVDFSAEVTTALRVSDGALVVVDYVEGVCVQTETVLRQALQELVRPVLFINKVDRAFFELNHTSEQIYNNFNRIINTVNGIITTYCNTEAMGDCTVSPEQGTVAFGSAYFGWGFSLNTWGKLYSEKFGIEKNKIREKLWGENYFDAKARKWRTQSQVDENSEELQRAFNSLIMDPIKKLNAALAEGRESYEPILSKLGIELTSEDKELTGKPLIRKVFSKWLNCADCLVEMITEKLPSPQEAQKYRVRVLYDGPLDDECAIAMRQCDPKGPLMMYVSKMVSSDNGRFLAFGRVFSGTLGSNEKVKILGPNYKLGSSKDYFEKIAQQVVLFMGRKIENIANVPCGNLCAVSGIDQCLLKQGTLTNHPLAHPIRVMKFSVAPIVRMSVAPKNAQDLPKLVEGLQKLAKVETLVQIINTDTEHIIAGSGELHLEICFTKLVEEYAKIEIIKSDPIVPYKETVTSESSQVSLSKSQNKHNRIHATAEPINESLVNDIESGTLSFSDVLLAKKLVEKYEWESHDTKKLWCFGPDSLGPNVLVDKTVSTQYLNEVKDSIETAFQWVTKEGVLCEESLRGVRFNIVDASLHRDPSHRGSGQVMPAARRAFNASMLVSKPRLMEPVYLVDVAVSVDMVNSVYQFFNVRRGMVISEEPVDNIPLVNMKAYLPVSQSFGFVQDLRKVTSGKAFPQSTFDHWDILNDDPLTDGKSWDIVKEVRKRKGMKLEKPIYSDFNDKI